MEKLKGKRNPMQVAINGPWRNPMEQSQNDVNTEHNSTFPNFSKKQNFLFIFLFYSRQIDLKLYSITTHLAGTLKQKFAPIFIFILIKKTTQFAANLLPNKMINSSEVKQSTQIVRGVSVQVSFGHKYSRIYLEINLESNFKICHIFN